MGKLQTMKNLGYRPPHTLYNYMIRCMLEKGKTFVISILSFIYLFYFYYYHGVLNVVHRGMEQCSNGLGYAVQRKELSFRQELGD